MPDELNRREFMKLTTIGALGAGVTVPGGNASEALGSDSTVNPVPASAPPRLKADAFVAGSWNGILLVVDDATGFQVRVGTRAEGADFLDGDDVSGFLTGLEDLLNRKPSASSRKHPRPPAQSFPAFYESVTEVGPHARNGDYCRLAWNPLYPYDTGSRIRLEWSRLDGNAVLGKVTYQSPVNYMSEDRTVDVVLEVYSPLGFQAGYRIEGEGVVGQTEYWPIVWEQEWNQWKFLFSSNDPRLEHDREPGFQADSWKPTLDDSHWKSVRWGAYWQEGPSFINEKGYGWYRTDLVIPENLKGKTLRLDLGKISQHDWTYVNGELIGETSGAAASRQYLVSPGTAAYEKLQWGGRNTIAVQVQSASEVGGISSGPYLKAVRLFPPPRPRLAALATLQQHANFALLANRRPDESATYKGIEDLRRQMQDRWELGQSNGNVCGGLLFRDLHTENFKRSRDCELYFIAKVGFDPSFPLLAEVRKALDKMDLGQALEMRRQSYDAERVRVEGGLVGAAEMITNTLRWAVLYSPEQKRSFVVDSRRWFMPDKWTLFANSAVLTAWAAALDDQELAQNTLQGTLQEQLPDGRVMNAAGSMVSTPDRSQDMYAAYVAWKIYLKCGDRRFLESVYPAIKRWHEWWFADRGDGQPWRDGNQNGLLELGTNMSPFNAREDAYDSEEYGLHHQGAMWEAADDNPMWGYYPRGIWRHLPQYRGEEGVRFNYGTSTLNLDSYWPSGLYALSCNMLARIARELGCPEDERHFQEQYQRIKTRINDLLWDEKTGMYLNRFWSSDGGRLSYRKSSAVFYLMAAGVADEAQAKRLVFDHLLNPEEFWGKYLLPTIPKDDPAYPEQYYWRGNIWPPMNYFAYEGLKRYGYDDVAGQLAERTYQLVKSNWDSTGALWENYNSITGEGNSHGAGGSTKHYSWSAVFPLMAVMECIDQEAWGRGLRFGSTGLSQQSRIQNLPIRGHNYTVTAGPSLTELWRDGVRLFASDIGAVIRDFEWSPQRVTFNIKIKEQADRARITIGGIATEGRARPQAILDGESRITTGLVNSEAVFTVSRGLHSIEIITQD